MKIIYIILCLFFVSCIDNTENVKFANDFAKNSIVIDGGDWSLKVPNTWQNLLLVGDPNILAGYGLGQNKVFLTQEDFNGSLKDYASKVRGLLLSKGEHIIYGIEYTINNQDFYLLVGDTDKQNIWSWLTVKDNVGYGLTCGGDTSESSLDVLTETCGEISKSFKFNK